MPLILRQAKGSPLTFTEMDNNLTHLSDYQNLTNKPTLFSGSYADLTNKPTLATVATSGSYADLTNKPTLPTALSQLTNDVGFITSESDTQTLALVGNELSISGGNSVTLSLFSGDYNDLSNKPALFSGDYNELNNKPVLFSGDYNDLNNKPALFSGDYADLSNKPTLPTALSQLTNDVGFITTESDAQTLSLVGNVLSISGGNSVTLEEPTLVHGGVY